MKIETLKTNINHKKKYIWISLILWLLVSYSMFLASREEWLHARLQGVCVGGVGDSTNEINEQIILKKGTKITQSIVITSEKITGISLFFDGEKQPGAGEIVVEIKEAKSGKIIGECSRDATKMVMGQFNDFSLEQQVDIDTSIGYNISVKATELLDSELSISLTQVPEDWGIKMLVDDEKSEYVMEYRVINGNHNSLRFVVAILYLVMTLVFLLMMLLLVSKAKIEWLFVGFVLSVGFLYLIALPPYTVPDEASHFVTTYAHSSQLLGEEVFDNDGNIIVPNERLWGASEGYPDKESYVVWLQGMLGISEYEEKTVAARPPLEMRHPGYFPQVIGVTLGRLLNFNAEQIFFVGRVFALLWYTFIMYWAIKLMPFGKMCLIVIGTLPMTLQMAVSYNYDSVLLGMCFFVFAYLLHLIYERKHIQCKDVILLCLVGIAIASIKFIYLPILGLAIFIPKEKFGSGKNKWLAGIGVLGVCILTILCIKLSMITNLATPHTTFSVNPGEAITPIYILKNPITVLHIFWRTFEHQSTFYLSSMVASPLGWLEINLPNIVIMGFVLLLIFAFVYLDVERKEVPVKIQVVSTLLALGMMFLALLALLLDCTNVGSGQIAGFQGRYLLPALPLFMPILRNKIILSNKNIDGYILLFMSYLHCMTIFYLSIIIIGR